MLSTRVIHSKILTPAKSQTQTSSSSWAPEPKPLMSTSTPYNPRPPQPKPLMPPSGSPAGPPRGPPVAPPVAPPGSGSPWTTPHGAPPYDQSPRPGGSIAQPPPWSQGRFTLLSDHSVPHHITVEVNHLVYHSLRVLFTFITNVFHLNTLLNLRTKVSPLYCPQILFKEGSFKQSTFINHDNYVKLKLNV